MQTSPQLEIQGNYRAATAQDVDKVYSRNLAQRQIFVSKFAQKDPQGGKDAESIEEGPSAFLGECLLGKTPSAAEFNGLKPADWPLAILESGKMRTS